MDNNLIASKNPEDIPNISRVFIPLVCTEAAYKEELETINKLFTKLFTRLVVEQSSGKYSLEKLIGISVDHLKSITSKLIEESNGEYIEVPKFDRGDNHEEVKLYTHKLSEIYYIHIAIRDYLKTNNIDLRHFFQNTLSGSISVDIGKELFREAMSNVHKGVNNFIRSIFGSEKPKDIIDSLLIVACSNHVGNSLPSHDGGDIKRVLNSFETIEDLDKEVSLTTDKYINSIFAKLCFEANGMMKKKKKVLLFIEKATSVNQEYLIENLELEFQNNDLIFSNHRDHFSHRKQMFNFLKFWSIDSKDLEDLKNQHAHFFQDFDLEKWIQQHRGYLPGFSIFYRANLETSKSKDEFISKMISDLETHYKGGQFPARVFTDRMKQFLPIFAGHFWEEYCLTKLIAELRVANKSEQETIAYILNHSVELKLLSPIQSKNRNEHMKYLVRNAFVA
jgi:hypothetical protein